MSDITRQYLRKRAHESHCTNTYNARRLPSLRFDARGHVDSHFYEAALMPHACRHMPLCYFRKVTKKRAGRVLPWSAGHDISGGRFIGHARYHSGRVEVAMQPAGHVTPGAGAHVYRPTPQTFTTGRRPLYIARAFFSSFHFRSTFYMPSSSDAEPTLH